MPDIVFLNASTGESKKLDLKTVTKLWHSLAPGQVFPAGKSKIRVSLFSFLFPLENLR